MDGALLKVGYEEKRERVYVRNEIEIIDDSDDS